MSGVYVTTAPAPMGDWVCTVRTTTASYTASGHTSDSAHRNAMLKALSTKDGYEAFKHMIP